MLNQWATLVVQGFYSLVVILWRKVLGGILQEEFHLLFLPHSILEISSAISGSRGNWGIGAVVIYQSVWMHLNTSTASTGTAALRISLYPRLLNQFLSRGRWLLLDIYLLASVFVWLFAPVFPVFIWIATWLISNHLTSVMSISIIFS